MLIKESGPTARDSPDNKDGGNQLIIPVIGSLRRNSRYKRSCKPSITKPSGKVQIQ
jgi:hypothetical protein